MQRTIRLIHGCGSRHVESIPFYERFQNKTAWHGNIEVFDLVQHEQARRCYAWQYRQVDETIRTVVLLELPPVDSPQSAVKAAVTTGLSQLQKTPKSYL